MNKEIKFNLSIGDRVFVVYPRNWGPNEYTPAIVTKRSDNFATLHYISSDLTISKGVEMGRFDLRTGYEHGGAAAGSSRWHRRHLDELPYADREINEERIKRSNLAAAAINSLADFKKVNWQWEPDDMRKVITEIQTKLYAASAAVNAI